MHLREALPERVKKFLTGGTRYYSPSRWKITEEKTLLERRERRGKKFYRDNDRERDRSS